MAGRWGMVTHSMSACVPGGSPWSPDGILEMVRGSGLVRTACRDLLVRARSREGARGSREPGGGATVGHAKRKAHG